MCPLAPKREVFLHLSPPFTSVVATIWSVLAHVRALETDKLEDLNPLSLDTSVLY